MIRYVAVDNIKRGCPTEPAALVVHSTWQFGKAHCCVDLTTDHQVREALLNRTRQLFPSLPETPFHALHKWQYSQVRTQPPQEVPSNLPYSVLNTDPLVLCAGDGLTFSSLEGCFQSAVAAATYLHDQFRDRIQP